MNKFERNFFLITGAIIVLTAPNCWANRHSNRTGLGYSTNRPVVAVVCDADGSNCTKVREFDGVND